MGGTTGVLAGCLTGAAAAALSPWTQRLAGGTRSSWVGRRTSVPLGFGLGIGAATLASGWVELVTYLALALACALLVAVDLATHRLPDLIVGATYLVLFAGLTVAAGVTGSWGRLGRAALAAAVVTLCYLGLALVVRGGLGLGDVKLAGLLGAFLGWQGWSVVALGTLAAFVVNGVVVAALLVSGRVDRRGEVAFGPWLVLGAALASGWAAQGVGANPFT